MGILSIFQTSKLKAELEQVKQERDKLKSAMSDVERMEAYGLKKAIEELSIRKKDAVQQMEDMKAQSVNQQNVLKQQINDLNRQISVKQNEIVQLDDENCSSRLAFTNQDMN